MVGIYFSGTGNTEHCVKKLVSLLDGAADCCAMESEGAEGAMEANEFIVFGYPTQYSNAPLFVRDFIKSHGQLWRGKKILCMATMGLFSGDGAGCSARLFRKYGAEVVGGLHIHMPDAVCDSKALKKSLEENRKIVLAADQKLERAAAGIGAGVYPQEGLNFWYHMAGLFGQRLWFYGKTQHYSDRLKINGDCVGCGMCAGLCPMKNIRMVDGRPVPGGHCTMCYRCISSCPKQAITLLGKTVQEQCRYEKYKP